MSSSKKNLSRYKIDPSDKYKVLKIAVIVSEWNKEITENLYNGVIKTLIKNGVDSKNIHRCNVPGSFELIYGSKVAQKKNIYNAIIAVGSIIRGKTSHFNFISTAVANGISELNVSGEVPVIFCVLTDNNITQSIERSGGVYGNKGVEAAISALKIATLNFN
ncbi:MAG: 6,7-dimethyl-8-ribityllumazine synthase [Flavobacteriaceae bacterium]|nr:6,7-dimethyl-8-ribityllumazine synthase [Flavobacteriaceae bacterium]|tara:strand:- start:89 stop:574 length:486 start_codon:yes stop_codon:yes gene_type:complete